MGLLAAFLLTGIWGYLLGWNALKQIAKVLGNRRDKGKDADLRKALLMQPFLTLWEKACRMEAAQQLVNRYHLKLMILHGYSWSIAKTKEEGAGALGLGYAAMTACCLLSWLAEEPMLLAAGVLALPGLGFRGFAEAGKKLEQRKKLIIAALPDKMSKLMLLVSAGETVPRAFARCLEGSDSSHPLDKEWGAAVTAMNNGQSFNVVMERFNRGCSVQEASLFTTVMLLNYRKGGEHFVLAVRELSYSLWEKRKALARTSGEEASSKLIFPLAGVMFIMMIIVAAPAILLMS